MKEKMEKFDKNLLDLENSLSDQIFFIFSHNRCDKN